MNETCSMTEHSASTDKILKTREEITRQSICNISDAISTVVSHSTNDEFRNTCFSLLEVPNSSSLAAAVSSKLTSISSYRYEVSLPSEAPTTQQQPPVVLWGQLNSQQSSMESSLQKDQEISQLQPTDNFNNAFDLDFNDDDFFDEIKTTVVSETKRQIPPQFDSNVATSSIINPPKSLEVPSSPFIKGDWFDEVLDTDLFFNES
ncbi:uncharacterized protein LOC117296194 isoform X2 [Asterias rubens]|uniref:uncharacterized protein LOC117296194 isoform X2 n=1 Tax=Asterias rubens TaxID=7604 RepID=UPI001455C70C|nr:uncharacterized protein LOC117296194 isoform X2 [Asterias rubens]